MPPKIAVITGPTATGKTKLGVELALELEGEVVSADSMQIYKGMDIGTAKPTPEETKGVAHHMLGIVEPREEYSVSRYVIEAAAVIENILERGKLPILVGGTGLYIDSLISGRSFAGVSDDGERAKIEGRYDELGGEKMLEELRRFDPQRAEKLSPSDKKRIVRAMEVYSLTGKSLSQHDLETKSLPPRYDARRIALSYENRQDLYDKINARVDIMIESGLLEEVQGLLQLPPDTTAMQAIGYRELLPYFRGECSLESAIELIKMNSRRYAKRQLTWLRRREDVLWILWKGAADFPFARQKATEFVNAPL